MWGKLGSLPMLVSACHDQLLLVLRRLEGKRLTYTALKQPNGLPSGART